MLLIDDNPDDRALILRVLRREIPDLDVKIVLDAESLGRALDGPPADLVVTDYQLRFSDGLLVLAAVKTRWPGCPVVMFTGTGNEEIAVEAMKGGLDDYVVKSPKHLVRLPAAVRSALVRARERRAAAEAEKRYRALFERVPLGLYSATLDGDLLDANPALVRMLGYPDRDTLLGVNVLDLCDNLDDRLRWREAIGREGAVRGWECRWRRLDGSLLWLEDNAVAVRDAAGQVAYCEGSLEDVTERRRMTESLKALETAVGCLPLGVTITDVDGQILYTNPADAAMHGYSVEELMAREARLFVPSQYWDPLTPERLRTLTAWKRERTNVRKDGSTFPAQLISDVVMGAEDRPIAIVTTCEDITERKRAEDQLLRHAFYDTLTSLPNRALFLGRLSSAIDRARRRPALQFAVLFLDLDRFKLVNDSLGHLAGDQLLVEVARRLETCIRPSDTVARFGGDEFAVLAEELTGILAATRVADRILEALKAPIRLDGHETVASASIGIALRAGEHDDPQKILRDADTAMYRAKALGKSRYEIFDEAMHARAAAVFRLEADLRRALERDELEVYYQPIVSLTSGRTIALEALLRWQHPERGLLLPEQFIPVAEESGLIIPVGDWVLGSVRAQQRIWELSGLGRVPVAVNFSPRQFRQRDLPAALARVMREAGGDGAPLELELTESAVMDDVDAAVAILRELREIGVRVSIDDFGTGYSSLAYLKRFPIDTLKIDRSFVATVPANRSDAAIALSVITLAHSMDLQVVAEGVETAAQRDFLLERGCDAIQGYLCGPPAPPRLLELGSAG